MARRDHTQNNTTQRSCGHPKARQVHHRHSSKLKRVHAALALTVVRGVTVAMEPVAIYGST